MNDPSPLTTVTALLQRLLSEVASTVTAKPPSTARRGEEDEQLNLFLYSVNPDSAVRSFSAQIESRDGQRTAQPLSYKLRYLITAYGAHDDDISGQRLMGKAIGLLNQHPSLNQAGIKEFAPDFDLGQHTGRLAISAEELPLDQLSMLWAAFQTAEYRLSVSYEVRGVLIDIATAKD